VVGQQASLKSSTFWALSSALLCFEPYSYYFPSPVADWRENRAMGWDGINQDPDARVLANPDINTIEDCLLS